LRRSPHRGGKPRRPSFSAATVLYVSNGARLCIRLCVFKRGARTGRRKKKPDGGLRFNVQLPIFAGELSGTTFKPGDILQGDFWPEPVRVLTVQALGQRFKVEAVGLRSPQFFPQVLSADDATRLRLRYTIPPTTSSGFTGRCDARPQWRPV